MCTASIKQGLLLEEPVAESKVKLANITTGLMLMAMTLMET
jgi:hypothetical protein